MGNETQPPLYAFEITLHGLPAGVGEPLPAATGYEDLGTAWPTVAASRAWLAEPMAVDCDVALDRLGSLDRMFVEPDGALVWASPREERRWQVDGNVFEKEGRVLLVDLRGSCPPEAFDRLLACFGWPAQRMIVQLVRPAVFLDEATFRRHALTRGFAGDGEILRPR